jgi:hypothetical protein
MLLDWPPGIGKTKNDFIGAEAREANHAVNDAIDILPARLALQDTRAVADQERRRQTGPVSVHRVNSIRAGRPLEV